MEIRVTPLRGGVHMGDLFFNGRYPFIDIDNGGSLPGMVVGTSD